MKKALSLVLAAFVMLSMVSVAGAAKFADVDANYSWALEAIEELSEQGVITGYDDGTFQPGKSITRQEAMNLFSKALGASAPTHSNIVEFAYGIYEAELESCAESYAVKPASYLVYKNILSTKEVIEYLEPTKRNLELKRCEAAALIAKALGADEWLEANKNADTTVRFADVNAIPAKYLKYVFYATEAGIMGEMGDNLFGPNEKVTRAQIAVMIKRISDALQLTYANGLIASVDTLNNNIVVKTADGAALKYSVRNSDVLYLDASRVTLTELEVGMEASIILSKNEIYEISAISHAGEETFAGAFKSKRTDNSGTTVKIADMTKEGEPISSFKLASNVVIFYKGETIENLDTVKVGDYVKAEISDGLVMKLIVEAKEEVITGLKITAIDGKNADGVILTTLNKEDEEVKYIVGNEVAVMKNSVNATIKDVVVGDVASLTLSYGVVSVIKATGVTKTLEGTIEEITISNDTSYLTITKDNTRSKYILARDCAVTLEDKEATVYDLRLGSYVKLKTESETVVAVSAEAVESALQVTGVIKTINSTYGLLVVEVETTSGNIIEKQVFVKDSTKIIDSTTGKTLTIKNLEVGDIITAAGVEKLGVYEANAIMVLQ